MIPHVSRFDMVIWLLVMCRSRGAKNGGFSGHVADHCLAHLLVVKDKLNCRRVCVPVTIIFALNQRYFISTKRKMAFATRTPESARVKIQNLVAG